MDIMPDEPTWKKRGCGTSILTFLMAVLAAIILAYWTVAVILAGQ